MTIESDISKVFFVGNGVSNTLSVTYPYINKTDVKVYKEVGGSSVLMDLNTDYTLEDLKNTNGEITGGTITFTVMPEDGLKIIAIREVPYTQEVDYKENDIFPAETLEDALDKVTMLVQQVKETADRSVSVGIFSDSEPSEIIGEIEELYAIKDTVVTAANISSDIVTCSENIDAIKDAPNQATSAAQSATEASASAQAAAISATDANASASAADSSAAASAGSAQTAQDYALQAVRRNVGDIFYTARLDAVLNGAVECNGAQYNVADFTGPQAAPALLSSGKLPYVSLTDFDAAVAANGSCRAFGWDGADAAVFKVPKLNGVYIMAGTAASAGEYIPESLPNVAVNTGGNVKIAASGAAGASSGAGALFFRNHSVVTGGTMGAATTVGYDTLYLDMSRSNAVFKNGAKVRPDTVRYRAMVQIATGAGDEALGLKDANNFTSTGKETVVGWCMPSTRYIDLTLGVSDSTYTAPANGWFCLFTKGLAYLDMCRLGDFFGIISHPGGNYSRGFVPVQKGQTIYIFYQGTPTNTAFRFYYAEGDE